MNDLNSCKTQNFYVLNHLLLTLRDITFSTNSASVHGGSYRHRNINAPLLAGYTL